MTEVHRKLSIVPPIQRNEHQPEHYERIQYRPAYLAMQDISILPQGRKTFEDIDKLAEDMADKG